MKILVISQYYYPEDFRVNDICEELVQRGHQITVLTGLPNYPYGTIFKGYENSYKTPEIINGVNVIRCKNRPRKKGGLNLLFNYIDFAYQATKAVKRIHDDFDMIYAYQMSPITLVLPAIKYKKIHNVPLCIYVCDIWPESVRDRGEKRPMSKHNPIYAFVKLLSKKIYNKADIICTKCSEFIDYLVEVCSVDRKKCFVNYEHAETYYLKVNEDPIDNGIVDFMFLGNIGISSNCELIVRATSMLRGNNFRVHFVGDGSALENIKQLASNLNLNDIIVFHGRHPRSEITAFYNLADVCLLTLSSNSLIGLTPPAKLTGYMAACRPIVASINGAASRIIRESNCGFVCDANDCQSLAELMQKIIDDPQIVSNLGKNGREYFLNNYTINTFVSVLEKNVFNTGRSL